MCACKGTQPTAEHLADEETSSEVVLSGHKVQQARNPERVPHVGQGSSSQGAAMRSPSENAFPQKDH